MVGMSGQRLESLDLAWERGWRPRVAVLNTDSKGLVGQIASGQLI